jgi:hypothetical protein
MDDKTQRWRTSTTGKGVDIRAIELFEEGPPQLPFPHHIAWNNKALPHIGRAGFQAH